MCRKLLFFYFYSYISKSILLPETKLSKDPFKKQQYLIKLNLKKWIIFPNYIFWRFGEKNWLGRFPLFLITSIPLIKLWERKPTNMQSLCIWGFNFIKWVSILCTNEHWNIKNHNLSLTVASSSFSFMGLTVRIIDFILIYWLIHVPPCDLSLLRPSSIISAWVSPLNSSSSILLSSLVFSSSIVDTSATCSCTTGT